MGQRRLAELLPAKRLASLPPGWHNDGRGLYLLVTPAGSRRWVLRTVVKGGKRREFGLGSLYDVPISEARSKASEMRRSARIGRDPRIEHRVLAAQSVTFSEAFDAYMAVRSRSLTNAKHLRQWGSTMEAYVFPTIGDRPVAEINSGEVLAVLEPIWHSKPETAKRVLQRVKAVMDAAILHNWRERASPCIGVTHALGGTIHRLVRHHRALPYNCVASFLNTLRHCHAQPETKLAFEWLILTATRSGETRGAMWCEIDEDRALWVIPFKRMKGSRQNRKDHLVPLPGRCLEILAQARALHPNAALLFPSQRTGNVLSDMAFTKLLRDVGLAAVATAHGFRSSFRDWATEVDKVREVIAEAALAHAVKNRTEAAYRRASYLEERRGLMERWSSYIQSGNVCNSAEISQDCHAQFVGAIE